MAGDVQLALAERVMKELEGVAWNHYLTLISITIVVMEYFLTFADEVERFWRIGILNWAAGLFFLNRYLTLLGHAPVAMEFFWTTSAPGKLNVYHQILAVIIQIIVAAMLVMRMYALYEKSKKVLFFYIILALLIIGIGAWAVITGKDDLGRHTVVIPVGCEAILSRDQGMRLGCAWIGMLVFDVCVFGMTLYKSFRLPKKRGVTLLSVVLRDGSMYFGVMIAINLGNILTFMLGGPHTRGIATTFMNVVSSVLISRLMLNLRDPILVPRTARHEEYRTDMTVTNPNLTFLEDGDSKSYGMETMGTEGRGEMDIEVYDEYLDMEPSTRHPAYRARYLKEEMRASRDTNPWHKRKVGRREDQYDYNPRRPGRPRSRNRGDDDIQVLDRT